MKGHYYFKILFTLLFLFLCANVGWSNQLSPDQALRRASGNVAATRSSSGGSYNLSFTGNKDGKNILYVFNNSRGGFIVVSADDSMPALLGYSNTGSFSQTTASPTLRWWLGQYTSEGSYYLHNQDKYKKETRATRASRTNIPAMVNTNWNQSEPYNNDCPEVGGNRTVTGCVATAMAQVIRYHAYPTTGTGTHSYSWNGGTLSFDYGSITFDYDNMPNDYDSDSSEAQNAAVASLMYACGVGVNMNYGVDESGAADMYIPYALKNFFGYAGDVRYLPRSYYTNSDWEDMVYAELEAKRPVIYGGQSNSGGGHEFVCDGYEDGYFHINWGWGGMGNGYFLLSALDPGLQGIGGFEGGYNSGQTMICGIQPTGNGTNWYPVYATVGIQVSKVQGNQVLEFTFPEGGVYNNSPEPVTMELYLKVVSESGNTYLSDKGAELNFGGANGLSVSGFGGLSVYIPQNLPEGDYKAYLVFKTPEGNWQDLLIPVTDVSSLDMNVDSSGNVTFKEGVPVAKPIIEVTAFSADNKVESGSEASFNISVKNTSEYEYSGVFYVRVYKEGTEEMLTQNGISTSIAAGGELSGTVKFTFDIEDGKYDAVFYDKYGDKISNVFPLYIGVEPTVADGITLDKTEATLTVEETLTLTATVTPEDAADKTVTWSSSDTEVATVENGKVTAVKAGTATITAETVNGHKATCEITVKEKEVAAEGITLDKTEATLTVEETLTLAATVSPETTTDKTVTWSSSDTEVATVENGKVTAVKAGTATITAETVNGHKATCEITVKDKEITAEGITLDKTEATLTVEETLTLTATVSPETTTDKTVTWSSSDTEVATVENGKVTAVKAGTATITAETVNGHKATCEITVKEKEVAAEGITLDKTEATLTVEETLTLTATVSPETTTDKTVTWSSSDTEVATVENGKVTAVKAGTATITAETVNGHKATCEITVKEKEVAAEGITLDKTEATLTVEETLTLTATVSPETTTDKTVTWSSSDTEVATVENGKVTAVKAGTATITAETVNGHKATCEITVKEKEVAAEGITLDKTEATLTVEETLTLTATVSPETTTDKTVTWSSSDTEVATVENGKVTAVKAGTATITAETVNGHKATCEITVKDKEVAAEGITLDKTEATLTVEETLTLTATVSPETTTDKTVTWSSSDTEVATVENGKVTAVKAGTATITAETVNGHKATCEITVKAKEVSAEGITLDRTEATIETGEKVTLTATISPEATTDKTVTWSSSDTEVATVENGVVTAVKVGTATITAETVNGLKATCTVTVKDKVILAEGISLDKTEVTLTEEETLTLTATVTPDNTTDKTVTWKSSDTEVATVENGKVTAVKAGTATITAETINGLKATCEVTVKEKEPEFIPATSITLDKSSIEAIVGTTVTLTATVLPENASDKTVTWSSSDETVATVDNNGKVSILSVGNAVITATTNDGTQLKAECTVSGVSGIEALVLEAGSADVYSVNGFLVKKNADSEYISNLPNGTYIIRIGNTTYKVIK